MKDTKEVEETVALFFPFALTTALLICQTNRGTSGKKTEGDGCYSQKYYLAKFQSAGMVIFLCDKWGCRGRKVTSPQKPDSALKQLKA